MRKKAVELPGVTLGEGMPKVCVPVMGADARALRAAADAARAQADLIELRLDSVSPEMDAARLRAACRTVREAAQGTAILATMRTARDGGAGDADAARYEALLVMLARERLCDALDVELSVGEAAFSRIARAAHEAGMPVIGSCHDFEKTPDAEEMAARLCRMAALGADICKIAVMPRKRRDVVALTAACAQADDALTQPIIAISMGEMGMPTRICAEAMGSELRHGGRGERTGADGGRGAPGGARAGSQDAGARGAGILNKLII